MVASRQTHNHKVTNYQESPHKTVRAFCFKYYVKIL